MYVHIYPISYVFMYHLSGVEFNYLVILTYLLTYHTGPTVDDLDLYTMHHDMYILIYSEPCIIKLCDISIIRVDFVCIDVEKNLNETGLSIKKALWFWQCQYIELCIEVNSFVLEAIC